MRLGSEAEVPVRERKIQTILVPTDFSEGAAYALEWARTLSRAFRAKIVVLHVFGPSRCLDAARRTRIDSHPALDRVR